MEKEIIASLQAASDEKTRVSAQHFFREAAAFRGVKSPVARKIAQNYWKAVKSLPKKEIFALCEKLLKTGFCEDAFVVAEWVPRMMKTLDKSDLEIFRRWIGSYIDNWAKCDSFCNHSVGELIMKYPELVSELPKWSKSKNRWMRRASAVSLIVPAKRGMFMKEAFSIADILLMDEDDMVQKGYGWLLKEESRKHTQEVFSYVMKYRAEMPRTALRYAIELMPAELKKRAMEKP
jgi:3-methyladenine DNA glycosylase AlkD